ncbi:chemotaxis protein CheX [bacterium]|nr:chemotaxis protein CheX [bacterium]
MKVEFIEPFVSAAFSVLETLTGERPTRGQIALRTSTFTTQQVTIVAGVNGNVEGVALYGMSMVTSEKIASVMIGSPVAGLDDMALSAISELGNMVTGNAITSLSRNGYDVDITPPSVIKGTHVEMSTRIPALVVPVITNVGAIEVNVALAEIAAKKEVAA